MNLPRLRFFVVKTVLWLGVAWCGIGANAWTTEVETAGGEEVSVVVAEADVGDVAGMSIVGAAAGVVGERRVLVDGHATWSKGVVEGE